MKTIINKKTKRRTTRRTFQAESLESRQMMAADLVASPIETVFSADFAEVAPETSASDVSSAISNKSQAMRSLAETTGRIALDQIDGLATYAGITIDAPTFASDGSVTGTTQFGDAQAPVLLQFVESTNDWVLAVRSELGELLPSHLPLQSPLELASPIFVFSPSEVQVEAHEMSEGSRQFYASVYESDDFTIRLERGVNLLTRGTIAEDSIPADILDFLKVDVPAVELEGVVLRDFSSETVEEFKQARKDGNFWGRFREDMLLRATLPQVTLDGLPSTVTIGDTFLGWSSPGTDRDVVFAALEMTIDDGDGTPTELTGRLAMAETPTGSELRLSAMAENMNDAFGITGLDLNQVTVLLDIDTVKKPEANAAQASPTAVPTFGLGLAAKMTIGDRDVLIAGKVELSMVTGTAMKVALRGELSSLSSTDLLRFANKLTGLDALPTNSSSLPVFELRNLMVNIAPLGGDAELGIEDGIGLRGELYLNGNLLGSVDALIDRTGVTPKIMLVAHTEEIELGELSVSDVDIDILMTQSVDDHFIVKGKVELFDASHTVDIHISSREMYYNITTEVPGLGLVDYRFESSTLGVPFWTFAARVRNDLSHTLEHKVAGGIRDWAAEARRDFDTAQAAVDRAQSALSSVRRERNAALAEAQRDFDKVKSDLASAERAVSNLASRVSSLFRSESRAHSQWRSAVRSRQSARWYNYAQRRAVEVARYATYRGIQATRIAAQGSLRAAEAVLSGVRHAAGWVLDVAGPEFHPEVVRLTAELALKTAALEVAETALEVAETVSTGAADVVAFVAERHDDLFMIDEISFEGTLSAAILNSSIELDIDYRFLNKEKSLSIDIASPVDFDNLASLVLDHAKAAIA